jgi:hypothetical protein
VKSVTLAKIFERHGVERREVSKPAVVKQERIAA